MTRKLLAVACIAALLFTIVVIVSFAVATLGTPVQVARRADSPRLIAHDVALASNTLLRGPPRSA